MDISRDARTILERAPMGLPRSILLAAAVGGAFGLGLVAAGGGDAHANPPEDAKTALASADTRTERYEALVKASTATWHQELTTAEPATTLPQLPGPKPKVAAADAAAVEAPTSSPTVAAEVVAALREPVATPSAPAKKSESAPEAHADNDDRADQEGDADRAAAKDPRRLAQAIESVVGERPKASAPATDENRRFALQLASTGTAAGAKVIAEGFKSRGFATTIASAEVPGRGTVYRVRIGGLPGRAAAEAMKAKVGQGLIVGD